VIFNKYYHQHTLFWVINNRIKVGSCTPVCILIFFLPDKISSIREKIERKRKKFFLTCWRAAASCSSLSASENFINHWARGLSLVSPLFLLLVSSTGTVRKQEVNLSIQRKAKSTTGSRQLRYILGGGKVKPAGNLGRFTAGWLCTRAKKPSEGSGNTISSYDSTTTGFLIDTGPGSSSGYNFKWWYLWIT